MKQLIKALNTNSEPFKYLKGLIPQLYGVKVKAGRTTIKTLMKRISPENFSIFMKNEPGKQ